MNASRNRQSVKDYRLAKEKATLISERGLYLMPATTYSPTHFRVLTRPMQPSRLALMEVHLRPETESRIQELSAKTGRAPDDLVEDAMAGYLQELSQVRDSLDSRYDDLKSGRAKPVDGEDALASLRRKSADCRANRS
jgi:predicted DNA-binding protein